eukprot:4707249-Prymnesium_polylepis.1
MLLLVACVCSRNCGIGLSHYGRQLGTQSTTTDVGSRPHIVDAMVTHSSTVSLCALNLMVNVWTVALGLHGFSRAVSVIERTELRRAQGWRGKDEKKDTETAESETKRRNFAKGKRPNEKAAYGFTGEGFFHDRIHPTTLGALLRAFKPPKSPPASHMRPRSEVIGCRAPN